MRVENPAAVVEHFFRGLELLDRWRTHGGIRHSLSLVRWGLSFVWKFWKADPELYRKYQTASGMGGESQTRRNFNPQWAGRDLRFIKEFAARNMVDLGAFEAHLLHNDYPGLDYQPHPAGGYRARVT